jgi:hypothetical protein
LHEETGVNYLLCQSVFGGMGEGDAERSLTLLAREVMPAFTSGAPAP